MIGLTSRGLNREKCVLRMVRNVLLKLLRLDEWWIRPAGEWLRRKILCDDNDEEMRKVFIKLLRGLDRWWIWRCLESSARCCNSKYDFITPPHLILHIFVNSSSSSWAPSSFFRHPHHQGCIFRLTCSYPEPTKDHLLISAYVKIFRTVTRNAVKNSAWRKKDFP